MPLGEEGVYLLHKLEGGVLLVQDQSVDVVNHNRNFSSLEEQLELLPVVLLLRVVFGVIERMHLDFGWEVSREDLSHEETVVERSPDVLYRVGQIEGLKPFENFSWEACGGGVRVDQPSVENCCHFRIRFEKLVKIIYKQLEFKLIQI